jgi:hypothetical protein
MDIPITPVRLAVNSLALVLGVLSVVCYAKLHVLQKPPGCLIISQQFLTLLQVIVEILEACFQ